MPSKDSVAKALVDAHFSVEPHLVEIWRVFGDNEASATEPIKLLEVNLATVATGSVTPFAFSPTQDVPYPTVVAEVTPEEFEAAKKDPSKLPKGWQLSSAVKFERVK